MRNVCILCPVLASKLTNTYRTPSRLFINDDPILSCEDTTQGDPLAMAMYAISMLPLIHNLKGDVVQVWYANDASACGRASELREWWDRLKSTEPLFGYHPKPSKTWLVVKPEHHPAAEAHFESTRVNITTQGQRYLEATLGSRPFAEEFVKKKVSIWISEIECLSTLPKPTPRQYTPS